MKKTIKEKLDILNNFSKPESKNARWKKVAKWNRKHAESLEDFIVIATRIAQTLKAKGMTQKELAGKLGVSPQALTRIMKGRQNLTLQSIRKIEKVLDISLITIQLRDVPMIRNRVKFVPVEVHYSTKARSVFSGNVDQLAPEESDANDATVSDIKMAS